MSVPFVTFNNIMTSRTSANDALSLFTILDIDDIRRLFVFTSCTFFHILELFNFLVRYYKSNILQITQSLNLKIMDEGIHFIFPEIMENYSLIQSVSDLK